MTVDNPGYHLRDIDKGELGTISKVVEEAMEALDAHEQGADIMVLIELSDLIGAVELYLADNHPSITLEDLTTMSAITARAFRSGRRT